ncbi:MAG: hypothetical protein EA383_05095 [Spirochaetaceae bacterium]|nr:MAG: hypothetical protein EA383_05095 [Spirochaetaceae bacterium]
MTRSPGRYIRAAIRRVVRVSAPGVAIPYVFLLLLISAVSIPLISTRGARQADLEVHAELRRSAQAWQLSVSAQPRARDEIAATLQDGLRARVTMYARLFATEDDGFSLLGRSVTDEIVIHQTLSYDPYLEGYRIVDSRAVETTVADLDAAIQRFFRIDGVLATEGPGDAPSHGRVRMVLEPRVIPDALYLVRAVSGVHTMRSPWVETRAQP